LPSWGHVSLAHELLSAEEGGTGAAQSRLKSDAASSCRRIGLPKSRRTTDAAKPKFVRIDSGMIEHKTIGRDEASRILALEENHFLDFKSSAIAPAKLSESISAFANTAGGELFIGISQINNKRINEWNGFRSFEESNGLFAYIQNVNAVASSYTGLWLNCREYNGYVLQLIIPKTRDIILATDGYAYVRHNAQNVRLKSPEEINRLQLDKGIVTYEDEITNVDRDTITNSIVTLKFILSQVPSAEPDEWMKKQSLLIDPGRPTVAGVLLFADEPQAALPKRSAIKVLRYGTREEEGRREQLCGRPSDY
jgi:ATP-dependent DNA helicase RecG